LFNKELKSIVGQSVDAAFLNHLLDDTAANTIPSSGTSPANAVADLRAALLALGPVDEASRLVALTSTDVAMKAVTLGAEGSGTFPGMTPAGGQLRGLNCLVSNGLPPGQLAGLDAAQVAAAATEVDVQVSSEADLEMSDAPLSNSTTPTGASLVSMFSTNSIAMRAVATIAASRLPDDAVVLIENIDWGRCLMAEPETISDAVAAAAEAIAALRRVRPRNHGEARSRACELIQAQQTLADASHAVADATAVKRLNGGNGSNGGRGELDVFSEGVLHALAKGLVHWLGPQLADIKKDILELQARPALEDAGVWQERTVYRPGHVVTVDGSAWVCREANSNADQGIVAVAREARPRWARRNGRQPVTTENVIAFRRPEAPLQYAEIRFHDETCNIQLCAYDEAGNRVVLTYRLIGKSPETFDMNLLRQAWERWRHESSIAS
jgi:hypothetical protein